MAISVGIVGASGATGASIVDGLLEDGDFTVVALTRPESVSKPANKALAERGVEIRAADLKVAASVLANSLRDLDVIVSAIGPTEQLEQINLATAAKAAGVKCFIPCGFITIIPVGGCHILRDDKEIVYNHIKRLHLPYTILDVGWWTQLALPHLPSGRLDPVRTKYRLPAGQDMPMVGDGNVPSALTDLRDIGRYTARILKDPRTLNKMVFVYNELFTRNQVRDELEKISSEKIPRNYVSYETLKTSLEEAEKNLKASGAVTGSSEHYQLSVPKMMAQYQISWGIEGHNTPEWAEYLGYINSKDLYPDFKYFTFEGLAKEALARH
ncbi:Valine--tRNA ligase [Elsinoe australis]|uniref:Valine--tRNA ligase n=1 Tax=Elsinoe australis TaxID=40998 RepID=A0A2P8A8N2_9PEZI|nr:Valine--tRNA ligase [Elsinoe australis]